MRDGQRKFDVLGVRLYWYGRGLFRSRSSIAGQPLYIQICWPGMLVLVSRQALFTFSICSGDTAGATADVSHVAETAWHCAP